MPDANPPLPLKGKELLKQLVAAQTAKPGGGTQ